MWNRTVAKLLAGSLLCSGLGGCVLDADHAPLLLAADDLRPTPTFSIGGTVKGATGPLALQNSNGTNVIVATDGAFTFETPMVSSAIYNVTVAVPPHFQTCQVARAAGTVADADIGDITVTCTANRYLSKR